MCFRTAALCFFLCLPILASGQNNIPHVYLFNQPISPFSASVAEAGVLFPKYQEPFSCPLALKEEANPLKLAGGITLPLGSATRVNLSAGKVFRKRLLVSVGYGGQNLDHQESQAGDLNAGGLKSRSFAFNVIYKAGKATFQAGGSRYSMEQGSNISEKGFHTSLGAAYTIFEKLTVGVQGREIPLGEATQTIRYIDSDQGVETERKEDNRVKHPVQVVLPVGYQMFAGEKLSAFLEVNGAYLVGGTIPDGNSKPSLGMMGRVGYAPFFLQGGMVQSGFGAGNFKWKTGVGAGVDLKNFSLIYSYSTAHAFKLLPIHSIGFLATLGS